MGFHTYDVERATNLEDASRYRYLSREELLAMLDPREDQVLGDLGSGTGFYTDDVAPYVGTLYAVDVQEAMHAYYREKGVPESVELVTADVADLPFPDDHIDGCFSTMTYHEFATDESIAELRRVLKPEARLAIVDWTADGEGADGPPLDERYDVDAAERQLDSAGFSVESATTRTETFVLVARL